MPQLSGAEEKEEPEGVMWGVQFDYSLLLLIEVIRITIFGRRGGREGPSDRHFRKSDPIFLGNFRNPLVLFTTRKLLPMSKMVRGMDVSTLVVRV